MRNRAVEAVPFSVSPHFPLKCVTIKQAVAYAHRIRQNKENDMQEFRRITFTPGVMGGQACIRGMRIPVSLVVNLVANVMTPDDIVREYPDLEMEDVKEALLYASWLTREEMHPARN
jgi:uncharacterized protein (DUF433 family)